MAKDYAKAFYNSPEWKACREAYKKSVGGLCERCMKKGLFTPAYIVHHKAHITPENISNPEITLNWGNLEALCYSCHIEEHNRGRNRRYKVDANGKVICL